MLELVIRIFGILIVKRQLQVNNVKTKNGFNHYFKYIVTGGAKKLINEIDQVEIIADFCSITKTKRSINEVLKYFSQYAKKIGYNFIGLCIPDEDQESLAVQTFDQFNSNNYFVFPLSETENYFVQTYIEKSRKVATASELSEINCPETNEYNIIPLLFQGECVGIVVAGYETKDFSREELLNTLCGYLGLLLCNHSLKKNLIFYSASNKPNASAEQTYEDELVKQLQEPDVPSKINLEVVTSLAAAIDAKDTYTKGHSQSVSTYAEALAKAISLDEQMIERVTLAAMLHDVGKIGISEVILRKPGPLTDHEWEVMKQHPIIGVKKVLEPVKSLSDLIPIVRYHHERIDGKGYPDRLKGDEIPQGALIVSIADAFHALISNRPYRKALSIEKTTEILRSGAGTQWDKDLVEEFISIIPEICN